MNAEKKVKIGKLQEVRSRSRIGKLVEVKTITKIGKLLPKELTEKHKETIVHGGKD